MTNWVEWRKLTGIVYDHNSHLGRRQWLESNGRDPQLASKSWDEIPIEVRQILTKDYYDEAHVKWAEPHGV